MQVDTLTELASGVDALYLSGRADLPEGFISRLAVAREWAVGANEETLITLGGEEFHLLPHGWQKYRYCLEHPFGRVGFTPSGHLPAIRVQPRAWYLHAQEPELAVEWFREIFERELGPVLLSVSRVDLFADFQGWMPSGDDRREFVGRALDLTTFETGANLTGLQFGRRSTETVGARLYDKTREIASNEGQYWTEIWGEKFDPSEPVLRVEFEVARGALRQFGVSAPEEVLAAAGGIWAGLTEDWLTHRVPSNDATTSRWRVSSQWRCVQHASVRGDAVGLQRTYDAMLTGSLDKIAPGLVGYLASAGALTGSANLRELIPVLVDCVHNYEARTGIGFSDRVTAKRRKMRLP